MLKMIRISYLMVYSNSIGLNYTLASSPALVAFGLQIQLQSYSGFDYIQHWLGPALDTVFSRFSFLIGFNFFHRFLQVKALTLVDPNVLISRKSSFSIAVSLLEAICTLSYLLP